MTHELTESELVSGGMPLDEAHEIANGTHPPYSNYDPNVLKQFPEEFNSNWFKFWDL